MNETNLDMPAGELDLSQLNRDFSIDVYLAVGHKERIQFKAALKAAIKELQDNFKLKFATKEDILAFGMKQQNPSALVISILMERLAPYNYDRTFHFRETIAELRGNLLEELYGGKRTFYDLGEEIGRDPSYVPFMLGRSFKPL